MTNFHLALACLLVNCGLFGTLRCCAEEEAWESAGEQMDFGQQILPIFVRHCFDCHGPQTQEGALRLDRWTERLTSGEQQLIRPGEAQNSRLYQLVAHEDEELKMPPEGPLLTTQELDLLKKWIDAGGKIVPMNRCFSQPTRGRLSSNCEATKSDG